MVAFGVYLEMRLHVRLDRDFLRIKDGHVLACDLFEPGYPGACGVFLLDQHPVETLFLYPEFRSRERPFLRVLRLADRHVEADGVVGEDHVFGREDDVFQSGYVLPHVAKLLPEFTVLYYPPSGSAFYFPSGDIFGGVRPVESPRVIRVLIKVRIPHPPRQGTRILPLLQVLDYLHSLRLDIKGSVDELARDAVVIYRYHAVFLQEREHFHAVNTQSREEVPHLAAHEFHALRPYVVFLRPRPVAVQVPPCRGSGKLAVAQVARLDDQRQGKYPLCPPVVFRVEIAVTVHVLHILHRFVEYGDVLGIDNSVLVAYAVAVHVRAREVRPGDSPAETRYVHCEDRLGIDGGEQVPGHLQVYPVHDAVAVEVGAGERFVRLLQEFYVGVVYDAVLVYVGKRFFLGGHVKLVIQRKERRLYESEIRLPYHAVAVQIRFFDRAEQVRACRDSFYQVLVVSVLVGIPVHIGHLFLGLQEDVRVFLVRHAVGVEIGEPDKILRVRGRAAGDAPHDRGVDIAVLRINDLVGVQVRGVQGKDLAYLYLPLDLFIPVPYPGGGVGDCPELDEMYAFGKLGPHRTGAEPAPVGGGGYLSVIVAVYPHAEPVRLVVFRGVKIPHRQAYVVKTGLIYFHVIHKERFRKFGNQAQSFSPTAGVIEMHGVFIDRTGPDTACHGGVTSFKRNAHSGVYDILHDRLGDRIVLAVDESLRYRHIIHIDKTVPVQVRHGKLHFRVFHLLVYVRYESHYDVQVTVVDEIIAVHVCPEIYTRVIKEYDDIVGVHIAVAVQVGVLELRALDPDPEKFRQVVPHAPRFVGRDYPVGARSVKPVKKFHGLFQVVAVYLPVRRRVLVRDIVVLPDQVYLDDIPGIDDLHFVKHGEYRFEAGDVVPVDKMVLVHIGVGEIVYHDVQKVHVLLVDDAVPVVIHVILDLFLELFVVLDGGPYAFYQELCLRQARDPHQVAFVHHAVAVYVEVTVKAFQDPSPVSLVYTVASHEVQLVQVLAGAPLDHVGEVFHPDRFVDIRDLDDPVAVYVIRPYYVVLDYVGGRCYVFDVRETQDVAHVHEPDLVIIADNAVAVYVGLGECYEVGQLHVIGCRHLFVAVEIDVQELLLVDVFQIRCGFDGYVLVTGHAMVCIKVNVARLEGLAGIAHRHLEAPVYVYFELVSFVPDLERIPYVLLQFLPYLDGLFPDHDIVLDYGKFDRVVRQYYPVAVGKIILDP